MLSKIPSSPSRPLKGYAPGRPPLEKLSNGPPGARRTPVNTAIYVDTRYTVLHARAICVLYKTEHKGKR